MQQPQEASLLLCAGIPDPAIVVTGVPWLQDQPGQGLTLVLFHRLSGAGGDYQGGCIRLQWQVRQEYSPEI